MRNPVTSNGDVPWQIRFAYVFGIPAIIAIYLIWVMANRIDNNISTIQTDSTYYKQQISIQNRKLEELQSTLTKICVNTATTAQEKNNCFTSYLDRREYNER